MMEAHSMKYLVASLAILTIASTANAAQKPAETMEGCPLSIALQDIDSFVEHQYSTMAESDLKALSEEKAAIAKANKPGVAIGRQMSPADLDRFNVARHALIESSLEELNFSKFQRNAHLIADVLSVAKLADLYDVKQSDLGQDDPRQFYYKVLLMLRANQPKPPRTAQVRIDIKCDVEAGLYWEEEDSLHQLAQQDVTAPQMSLLVADIERLRSLQQAFWKIFNHGAADVRAIRWSGDEPYIPDTMTPLVEGSDDLTKRLYKIVVAYIDERLPTDKEFEAKFRQKMAEKAERDNPLTDK